MKWQQKAILQAVLSRVPLGYAIHRRLQDTAGTLKLNLDDHYDSKAHFIRHATDSGMEIQGKTFLDIGTGWHPIIPLILHVLGAKRTVTIDLNPWLTRDSLLDTLKVLHGAAERIAKDFDLSVDMVRGKLGRLADCGQDPASTIDSLLRAAGIEYHCPVNAMDTQLAPQQFDCVLSFNVFEHVPPAVLKGILDESKRILLPGGMHLHHVGLGDHFSHVDKRITTANFLKYSAKQWYWIGGSGLAYHNRLRGIDFVRLFEKEGFEVLEWDAVIDKRALTALQEKKVVPHPDYAGYSHEELSGFVLNMMARMKV